MRKIILGLIAGGVALSGLVTTAGAASASTEYSAKPTLYVSNVAKGHTIHPRVYGNDSRVLSKVNTLWQGGHRVRDWSPAPGAYTVKSVITYRTKVTHSRDVWVADSYCLGGYDEDGNWDDNIDCYDNGYWDTQVYDTWSAKKVVTRYRNVRVASDESPGCVSASEFRQVKNGMSQKTVHAIFGTSGHVTMEDSTSVLREYETCDSGEYSIVQIGFDPRVYYKFRFVGNLS